MDCSLKGGTLGTVPFVPFKGSTKRTATYNYAAVSILAKGDKRNRPQCPPSVFTLPEDADCKVGLLGFIFAVKEERGVLAAT